MFTEFNGAPEILVAELVICHDHMMYRNIEAVVCKPR